MDTAVSISAEDIIGPDPNARSVDGVYVIGLERIHVSMAGEARCNGDEENGAEYRCGHCGTALQAEPVDGQVVDLEGESYCDNDQSNRHDRESVPLSWANSAAVWLDEEHDEITLTVSTGDPRGGFGLRVWRNADTGAIHVSPSDPENVTSHDPSVVVHYARTFPGISD